MKIVYVPALGWTLLAVSALGNVVLLARHGSPAEKRAAAVPAVFEASDVDSGGGHQLAGSETSIDAGLSSAAECEKTLLPLEAEVNALSIELRRRLPMHRLFALGEPNPETEQMFRPLVDRILTAGRSAETDASRRDPLPYTLECRDIVCQLIFIANANAEPGVVGKALGSDVELRSRVTSLSFPQSRLTEDIPTKTMVTEGKVYWRIREPDGGRPRP